jgi:deazaflavin-dependent oxidoreductase (nitroreductase family)
MAEKQPARPRHVPPFVTIFNRLVRSFAGRHLYALLRHRGRRSGKSFETPVMAWRTAGGILVPLAWGSETDWYRNLTAANGCEVQISGQWHRCAAPALLQREQALSYLPALTRAIARLVPVPQFVLLREVERVS